MNPDGTEMQNIDEILDTKKPIAIKKANFWASVKRIFVTSLILAVIILLASTVGANKLRELRAKTEVYSYIDNLYPGYFVNGLVCQGEDTDRDNFVTCDVNIGNASNEKIVNILCPTLIKSFMGASCKLSKFETAAQ